MSLLEKQIQTLKDIYSKIEEKGYKIKPIITGKFALSVYTQGLYPASCISLLFPDINALHSVLKELGFSQIGDVYVKDDITVEVSKKFDLIPTGIFNQIEVDGIIFNVISLEDLLVDMMSQCIEGDNTTCDLIKMLIKSYKQNIDFHHIYRNLKDKKAVIKFKEYQNL